MAPDGGSQRASEGAPGPRAARVATALVAAGALVVVGPALWSLAAGRNPAQVLRIQQAGLAVGLVGVAVKRWFWDAARSRSPLRQRLLAGVAVLLAAFMAVLAAVP